MQNCTRTCPNHHPLSYLKWAYCCAIILLVLSSSLKADEPKSNESLSTLEEKNDLGWSSTSSVPVASSQLSELININEATAAELSVALPGIGPEKAQRIVDWRNDNGAFQDIDQLLEISGIGPKTLERLSPLIHIGEEVDEVSRKSSLEGDSEHHRTVLLEIVERANEDAQQVLRDRPGS